MLMAATPVITQRAHVELRKAGILTQDNHNGDMQAFHRASKLSNIQPGSRIQSGAALLQIDKMARYCKDEAELLSQGITGAALGKDE